MTNESKPAAIKIGGYYRFTYPCYGTPDSHPDYTAHSGQIVQVDRQLTDSECDPESGPAFWCHALSDGWVGNIHSSELVEVKVRQWDNYLLLTRYSTGSAARYNRGRATGTKVHRIVIEEIVGITDEAAELAKKFKTIGQQFLKTRKPTKFSASPACGCTNGQNAASEIKDAVITCTKCGGQ